jgi:hypothetical protein
MVRKVTSFINSHATLGMIVYLLFRACCGAVYAYIHETGDARGFFIAMRMLGQAFEHSFIEGWQLLWYPFYWEETSVRVFFDYYEMQPEINYFRQLHHYAVVQLLLPLYFLTADNFYGMNIACGLLSGLGAWYTYGYFQKIYPHRHWWKVVVLFLPVSCFWASGISKETICFTLMMIGIVSVHRMICTKCNWKDVLIVSTCLGIIGAIRLYLAAGVGVMGLLWIISHFLSRKYAHRWWLYGGLAGICLIIIAFAVIMQTTRLHPRYIWAEIHYNRDEPMTRPPHLRPRSHFDLGTDTTALGIIKTIPSAVSAVLIRPFPWETGRQPRPVVIAVLDGIFSFFLIIWGLLLRRKNAPYFLPEDVFFLFFPLCYGAFLGLSVGNWGTLFRYKVYVLPVLLTSGGMRKSY